MIERESLALIAIFLVLGFVVFWFFASLIYFCLRDMLSELRKRK